MPLSPSELENILENLNKPTCRELWIGKEFYSYSNPDHAPSIYIKKQ